jgi:hypothetical protein
MARKSSVEKLDPTLREAIDRAIATGRASIDELVELVNNHGVTISRSAMGRYHANHVEALARYRESQALARQWMAELKENPDGDVAQLVAQQLKLQAHTLMMDMDVTADGADQVLARLAKATKDLAQGDKARAELRERITADQARAFEKAAAREGAGKPELAEALARIRTEIYGL